MEQKYIVLGVAAIVVLATVGCGFALLMNSNNGDNKVEVPDVTGKWNVQYMEIATLYDATSKKAITNANDVNIVDYFGNPNEPSAILNVISHGDHGFTGTFTAKGKEAEIHGSYNGGSIRFTVTGADGYFHTFKGAPRGDKYISASLVKTIPRDEASSVTDTAIVALGYVIFIRDGGESVPIRSDYFDMGIMNESRHIKSVSHSVKDFEGTGKGRDIGARLEFVKDHNMLSVFSVKDDGTEMGVQVVASMGTGPDGTMIGHLAGNLKSPTDTNRSWLFTGEMSISHGRAVFLHRLYHDAIGTDPQFVEFEYNVPYPFGGDVAPRYINEMCDYTGTLRLVNNGAEDEHQITRTFKVVDNTFCSKSGVDGESFTWFGEMYGPILYMYVIGKDYHQVGHLTGHITADGHLHMFGMVYQKSSNSMTFMEIELAPVKA